MQIIDMEEKMDSWCLDFPRFEILHLKLIINWNRIYFRNGLSLDLTNFALENSDNFSPRLMLSSCTN